MSLDLILTLRDFLVEIGVCRVYVSGYPKGSNAEAERADDEPADEAEVKTEESHLVAVHHSAAFVDALLPSVRGVVMLDKVRHRIAICLDDAGNYKKQGPKEGKYRDQQTKNDVSSKVRGKSLEEILDLNGIVRSGKIQKDLDQTEGKRTREKKGTDAGDYCGCNSENCGADQASNQSIQPFSAENIVFELLACLCAKLRCCHNKFLLKGDLYR